MRAVYFVRSAKNALSIVAFVALLMSGYQALAAPVLSPPSKPDLATASDNGIDSFDNNTYDDTPTFDGTAVSLADVTLTSNIDGTLGTTTADSIGTWSFTAAALTIGDHDITATQVDAAGNISGSSTPLVMTIVAPATVPSTPVLAGASDSGINTDNITNIDTPTFTGTASPLSTIEIFSGTTSLNTVTTNSGGVWSAIPLVALAPATHQITATAYDANGSVLNSAAALTLIVDTSALATSPPNLAAASDNGLSDTDNITNDATPTIDGTAEAGAVVTVSDGGIILSTVTADPGGVWSLTTTTMTDGDHVITATQTDVAGNSSVVSATLTITIDSAAPAEPDAPDLDTTPVTVTMIRVDGTYNAYDFTSINSTSTVQITFSEDVTGFGTNAVRDYVTTNTTLSATRMISPSVYEVDVSGIVDGRMTFLVTGLDLRDAAGNGLRQPLPAPHNFEWDTLPPPSPSTGAEIDNSMLMLLLTGNRRGMNCQSNADDNSILLLNLLVSGRGGEATTNDSGLLTILLLMSYGGFDNSSTFGLGSCNNGRRRAALLRRYDQSMESGQTGLNAQVTNRLVAPSSAAAGVPSGMQVLGTATYVGGDVWSFDLDVSELQGDLEIFYTVTDAAGNVSAPSPAQKLFIDTVEPQLTLSTTATAPHPGTFGVSAEFTEGVTGFDVSDIIVGNGTVSNFVATSDTVYTFDVTPIAEGAVTVDVDYGAAYDSLANLSMEAAQLSNVADGALPNVVLSTTATSPHGSGPFTVMATFIEDVTGFDATDISVGNGAVTNFIAASATEYTFDVIPAADGPVTVDIAAGMAQDSAGSLNAAASQLSVTVDTGAPTVVLTGPEGVVTGVFVVTATLDEAVTGLLQSEISVTNGSVTAFEGTGAVYRATIDPVMGEVVTVSIAADVAQDAAGNVNTASNVFSAQVGSPANEFDAHRDEIRQIVIDLAQSGLQNMMTTNRRLISSARTRFIRNRRGAEGCSDPCVEPPASRNDVAFDIDGTAQISNGTFSSQGTFFEQTGYGGDGPRRLFFGDFNVERSVDGTVSAQAAGRIAWERMISENTMFGYFIGAEIARASVDSAFVGHQDALGLSLGGYVVSELRNNLFANGYLSFGVGRNSLQLSNATLDLASSYSTRTLSLGFALTGVIEREGYEIWPELAFDYGLTHIGHIGLTGTAYGVIDNTLTLNAGRVSIASMTFAPEFRVPMDGLSVADSNALLTFAPRLVCEYVQALTAPNNCGGGAEFGVVTSSDDGLTQLEAKITVDRLSGRTRTGFLVNFERQF
jgi:hypothetical protein